MVVRLDRSLHGRSPVGEVGSSLVVPKIYTSIYNNIAHANTVQLRIREAMVLACLTYNLLMSPSGHTMDRRLVPALVCTQELHTIPKRAMKQSSRACRMSHIASLRIALYS